MLGNSVHRPEHNLHQTLGALFAGIALIALPLLRAVWGSAEPVEPIFWIVLVPGVVMLTHGIATLPLYWRNKFDRYTERDARESYAV